MSCHKHIEFPIIGLASKNIVVFITRHATNYGSNYFTEKAFYCCLLFFVYNEEHAL